MQMVGRSFDAARSTAYRYGFNGKETDKETNTQDYGLRIYDPRLGRFLSVDPLSAEYPWNSTYAFAENDVIRSIDLEGAEKYVTTYSYTLGADGKTVLTTTDDVWKQKTDISIRPLGTPQTDKQIAAHSSITYQRNPKPDNGSFAFFEFDPALGKANYAKYTYTDASGKQQVQYFSQADVQFRFDEIAAAKQKLDKAFSIVAATANFVAAGWLLKAEMKVFSAEVKSTINGQWVRESTAGWSKATIEYQEFVTGTKAGAAYEVGGVRFDGVRGGTLLEAKGNYDNFVNAKTGQFQNWFVNSKKGAKSLLDQAQRQITAANGASVEWNFSSQKILNATKSYFESQGIKSGITYKLNPKP
jgi:RHS repeat-associated protein